MMDTPKLRTSGWTLYREHYVREVSPTTELWCLFDRGFLFDIRRCYPGHHGAYESRGTHIDGVVPGQATPEQAMAAADAWWRGTGQLPPGLGVMIYQVGWVCVDCFLEAEARAGADVLSMGGTEFMAIHLRSVPRGPLVCTVCGGHMAAEDWETGDELEEYRRSPKNQEILWKQLGAEGAPPSAKRDRVAVLEAALAQAKADPFMRDTTVRQLERALQQARTKALLKALSDRNNTGGD